MFSVAWHAVSLKSFYATVYSECRLVSERKIPQWCLSGEVVEVVEVQIRPEAQVKILLFFTSTHILKHTSLTKLSQRSPQFATISIIHPPSTKSTMQLSIKTLLTAMTAISAVSAATRPKANEYKDTQWSVTNPSHSLFALQTTRLDILTLVDPAPISTTAITALNSAT